MQAVNLKKKNYNFHFILLTLLSRSPSLHRIFQFQDLWIRALVARAHTHTSSTLPWQLFSAQHSLFTRNTVTNWERLTFVGNKPEIFQIKNLVEKFSAYIQEVNLRGKKKKNNVCWVLSQYVLSFPVCFSLWGIKNFHVVFPNSFKERVTKTGIFQLLSKMHKMLLPK